MKPTLAIVPLIVLSACSGGFDITDFRANPTPAPTPAAVIAPPTPQPVLLTAKERLVTAIENNGCALTTDNVGAILSEATISQNELLQLTPQLVSEGRAEVAGTGTIRARTDRCT